jgi:hypothetical protein
MGVNNMNDIEILYNSITNMQELWSHTEGFISEYDCLREAMVIINGYKGIRV